MGNILLRVLIMGYRYVLPTYLQRLCLLIPNRENDKGTGKSFSESTLKYEGFI
ncbi:hypothetical protein BH20BAC1_BH20BAC1_23080 [soil metagenome]